MIIICVFFYLKLEPNALLKCFCVNKNFTRHLGTGIQEHLLHKPTKPAIRDHFKICQNCKLNNTDFNGFKVLRICNSEYATMIQEALLTKKHNPQLNRELYANGSSFLLNVY